jgi:hypothetical protein
MTPRQRVEAVLLGRPVDKVPFTIYESKIPQCSVERQLRNDGMCIVNRGYSVVGGGSPNVTSETHSYVESGTRYNRTVHKTPVGELSTLDIPAGFTSWHQEKLFKRPEDYKVLVFMAEDRQFRPSYDRAVQAQEWLGEDVILRAAIGSTPLHQIMIGYMGVDVFAMEWADRRDEIMKLYDALVEQRRRVYPLLAESPLLHFNYGGNETGDVMGRERFEEFVAPHYYEAAEHLHKHGKLVGTHLDGNNKVWAQAVADSPLDYIEAFSPAPDTDMSLQDAMDAWPGKVIWINFPSSAHLWPVEEIEEATRELIQADTDGRLIIGITEDVPDDRWQASLQAISRVVNAEAGTGA